MKFQKFLIFHLWVCVTDSPHCDLSDAKCTEIEIRPGDFPCCSAGKITRANFYLRTFCVAQVTVANVPAVLSREGSLPDQIMQFLLYFERATSYHDKPASLQTLKCFTFMNCFDVPLKTAFLCCFVITVWTWKCVTLMN